MSALNLVILFTATYLAVFLGARLDLPRQLAGTQIDLLPAIMICCGLRTNLATLTGLAVFGGLLFDSLSGNPLGVSMVSLFIVGFLAHRHHDLVLRDTVYAQFILGGAASFGAPVISLLLLVGMGHDPLVGWGTLLQMVVMALAGGCATPVCFRAFDAAERAFGYPRLAENSFRGDREIKRGRS